jgi:hypothetical protein
LADAEAEVEVVGVDEEDLPNQEQLDYPDQTEDGVVLSSSHPHTLGQEVDGQPDDRLGYDGNEDGVEEQGQEAQEIGSGQVESSIQPGLDEHGFGSEMISNGRVSDADADADGGVGEEEYQVARTNPHTDDHEVPEQGGEYETVYEERRTAGGDGEVDELGDSEPVV